jgi:hypothetical protein
MPKPVKSKPVKKAEEKCNKCKKDKSKCNCGKSSKGDFDISSILKK